MSLNIHPGKILVIQTAFLGDVILTLPLVQEAKRRFPSARIDVVVRPQASELFANHPSVGNIFAYDKRGKDKGVTGFLRMMKLLKTEHYDVALIPHRSLRSVLLASVSGIPVRIGFNNSTAKSLLTNIVRYQSDRHEIERNISLLDPFSVAGTGRVLPSLYPGDGERNVIERLLASSGINLTRPVIAVAPGTIWNTKRWLKERFAELVGNLTQQGCSVVLVGSETDAPLSEEIKSLSKSKYALNVAGTLTLLQSAELIRRCRAIVSNDSAPMHMAVAVRTPVVAIFGATVPAFGFAPYGEHDVVVETLGLACRPCSIHGGHACPVGTFDCMKNVESSRVLDCVNELLKIDTTQH
jgi:heptosyltransferase-2